MNWETVGYTIFGTILGFLLAMLQRKVQKYNREREVGKKLQPYVGSYDVYEKSDAGRNNCLYKACIVKVENESLKTSCSGKIIAGKDNGDSQTEGWILFHDNHFRIGERVYHHVKKNDKHRSGRSEVSLTEDKDHQKIIHVQDRYYHMDTKELRYKQLIWVKTGS